METLIVNVELLPPPIRKKFSTPKISVQEHADGVILMPVKEKSAELWGMLSDGKFTSEKFLEQKRRDKELES